MAVAVTRLRLWLDAHRRIAAVAVAIAINALIVDVLLVPPGPGGALEPEQRLEVVSMTLVRPPRVQRRSLEPPTGQRPETRRRASKSGHQDLISLGPPTETVAQGAPSDGEIRVTEIPPSAELVHRCREAYPAALASVSIDATVALQVFVMPDGRIGQGRIERSSGDAELDQAVFTCVQTFANLEPAIVGGNPVGSWQAVTVQWGRQ